MTRDRLNDLKKASPWTDVSYTEISQKDDDDDGEVSINNGHSTTISIDDRCPIKDFLQEINAIGSNINHIDELAQQVKKLHAAMPSLQCDSKLSQELDDKNEQIKNLAHGVLTSLKKMEQTLQGNDGRRETNTQRRLKESQIYGLNHRFREIMNQYNQEAVVHRQRCKKLIQRELEMVGHGMSDDELEEMLNSGRLTPANGSILVDTQRAKQTLSDLEARHRDIKKLQGTIELVHEMFRDLNMLVQAQGDIIDRIEHNVSKAENYVIRAEEEIQIAEEIHEHVTNRKFIVGIVLITGGCLVLFILFLSFYVQKKLIGR